MYLRVRDVEISRQTAQYIIDVYYPIPHNTLPHNTTLAQLDYEIIFLFRSAYVHVNMYIYTRVLAYDVLY